MLSKLIAAIVAGKSTCLIGSNTTKVAYEIASATGRDLACIQSIKDLDKYNNNKYLCCIQSRDLSLQKPFTVRGYLCGEDLVGISSCV